MPPRKSQRRQQILEALAQMLEANPGNRITTAGLAKQVGVSEAALYRHFPSKSKMFEGLIEFIEDTLFSRIKLILKHLDMMLQRFDFFVRRGAHRIPRRWQRMRAIGPPPIGMRGRPGLARRMLP